MTPSAEPFIYSEHENKRLAIQSQLLSTISASFLKTAGITRGMRVLDVGCATGELTFLTASIIGKDGFVIGLDRCDEAIQTAAQQANRLGIKNVKFVTGDLLSPPEFGLYDAIVGRFIWAYIPEIERSIRTITALLRNGGLLAFLEWDHSRPPDVYPRIVSFDQFNDLVIRTLRDVGVQTEIVRSLYCALSAITTNHPEIISYTYLTGDFDLLFPYLTDTLRSVRSCANQELLQEFDKIASKEFLRHLRLEAIEKKAVLGLSPIIGAWTHC